MFRRSLAVFSALAVAAFTFAGCAQPTPEETTTPEGPNTEQIVIDTTFDIATIDPGREYEPTGQIVVKALYDTLLSFADDDTTKVVPDLAGYVANDDLTEYTFSLVGERLFSDGTPLTADDVVFSLNRMIGMKGNPSFLLDGVTIEKVDDQTIKMTTEEPSPALPAVLATPSAGILNSKVVKENGGTTDETDGAEKYLNANSAGSGPYVLESLDVASSAVLVKNEKYNGPQDPTYDKVILRNVEPATQKMNVERGDAQIAMGLSGDQVAALDKTVNVASTPSATVVFLFLNQNPEINEWTAKPECVAAVKKALDYDSLLELAGLGASQATGVIPSGFLGALPKEEALKFDLAAGTKGAEDCGMAGQTIKLGFPNDIDPAGTSLTTVAQRVQQQLATAGIVVELAPAPFATEIDAYRDGKAHMGLWYWNPDYMDPANYLAFGPGQKVGLRAGWTAEMNAPIGEKVAAGYTTGDLDARKTLFEEWGRAMNAESPFIPLIQPGSNVAHQASVTNVYYNPTWLINVAGLGAA